MKKALVRFEISDPETGDSSGYGFVPVDVFENAAMNDEVELEIVGIVSFNQELFGNFEAFTQGWEAPYTVTCTKEDCNVAAVLNVLESITQADVKSPTTEEMEAFWRGE